MNPAGEGISEALDKIERAGAGIVSLGNLLSTTHLELFDECTVSGIGYLLEIVGDFVTVNACAGRDVIYCQPASGEAAPP